MKLQKPQVAPSGPESPAVIFISYSRQDKEAADVMVAQLERNGFAVKIDRRDLPYGEAFKQELAEFINDADSVVWLVSPASVKSPFCQWELGEVARRSKRLIPIMLRETPPETLPKALGDLHLLPAEGLYDPEQHEKVLVDVLNLDLPWLKHGTILGSREQEWRHLDQKSALLLRGAALENAEIWWRETPRKAPPPSPEIRELILVSRAAQRRRLRMTVFGALAFAVAGSSLAAAAEWFRRESVRHEEVSAQRAQIAIGNESLALSALSRVALADPHPADAVRLALASWPRDEQDARPALRRAVDLMAEALPQHHERMNLRGHEGHVYDAVYSRDGARIATASEDWTVRIWDAATGEELIMINVDMPEPSPEVLRYVPLNLNWINWGVLAVAFSPDGDRLVTGSTLGRLLIWDVATGKLLTTLQEFGTSIFDVSFSADGTLAVSTTGSAFHIWDARTGESIMSEEAPSHEAAVKLSQDGQSLSISSSLGDVTIWSIPERKQIKQLKIAPDTAVVAFSPDASALLTISADGALRSWDAQTGAQRLTIPSADQEFLSAAISHDGQLIALGYENGNIMIHSAADGRRRQILSGSKGAAYSVVFSSDDHHLLTSSADGFARIWNIPQGNETLRIDSLQTFRLFPQSVAFSPDGESLLVASSDFNVQLRDAATGDLMGTRIIYRGELGTAVEATADRDRIVTLFPDHTSWGWSIALEIARQERRSLEGEFVALSPDGVWIAVGTGYAVSLWRAGKREMIARLPKVNNAAYNSIAFAPQGRPELIAGNFQGVSLIDIADPQNPRILHDFPDGFRVASLAYSPDGERFVAGSSSGDMHLWDVASRTRLQRLRGHSGAVRSVEFSRDGSRIISASADGTARIWDAATGIELLALEGHEGEVDSAVFSPDGRKAATASADKTLRIWDLSDLEEGDAFQVACQRLANATSLDGVRRTYDLGDLEPICQGSGLARAVDLKALE